MPLWESYAKALSNLYSELELRKAIAELSPLISAASESEQASCPEGF